MTPRKDGKRVHMANFNQSKALCGFSTDRTRKRDNRLWTTNPDKVTCRRCARIKDLTADTDTSKIQHPF